MSDSLYYGRKFRTFNVIDEDTRECLPIDVDTLLPARRVILALERLKCERGLLNQIRLDNGPELIAADFTEWCEENNV